MTRLGVARPGRRPPHGCSRGRGRPIAHAPRTPSSTRRRSRHAPLRGLPPGGLRHERRALSGRVLPARPARRARPTTAASASSSARSTRSGRPAILVVPQGARRNEPDPEYLDRGPGGNWATAIAGELPRDRRLALPDDRHARGRALVGLSAGGFGAMHLALAHLEQFSVVESWSGYFHPTDPAGTKALDLGPATTSTGNCSRRGLSCCALHTTHRLLRRRRRFPLPGGEPAAEPGAFTRRHPARLPALRRRPRAGAVAAVCAARGSRSRSPHLAPAQ